MTNRRFGIKFGGAPHRLYNPICDPEAPKSIGGIQRDTVLCGILGLNLDLQPLHENYLHGWGNNCSKPKPILCSWTITLFDLNIN